MKGAPSPSPRELSSPKPERSWKEESSRQLRLVGPEPHPQAGLQLRCAWDSDLQNRENRLHVR